jgi:myo-inositol 2-dehydrogenase/D-chiro-inositol 1-dehydrogenase
VETVGIGIIGSGFMARTYAEVLARHARGGSLVAVTGGTRAPALAAEYAVAHAPTLGDLLARADVDAVVLAGPEQVRPEQATRAATAGKHILAEKPMATSVAACDTMIAACAAAGVQLMVVQSQRFRGVHQRAKRLLDAGHIGRLREMRLWSLFPAAWSEPAVASRPWYRDPLAGLFMSQSVHNFDLLRWLIGDEARSIYARITSYGAHGIPNLSAVAVVGFAGGATGHLWINMELPDVTFPDSQFHSQVVGERGLLDFDGYTHLDMASGGTWRRIWTQPPFDPLDPLDPIRLESFTGQLQAFIDCIRDGMPPLVTGADGRAAVELCQAALLSARVGQTVTLPLPV